MENPAHPSRAMAPAVSPQSAAAAVDVGDATYHAAPLPPPLDPPAPEPLASIPWPPPEQPPVAPAAAEPSPVFTPVASPAPLPVALPGPAPVPPPAPVAFAPAAPSMAPQPWPQPAAPPSAPPQSFAALPLAPLAAAAPPPRPPVAAPPPPPGFGPLRRHQVLRHHPHRLRVLLRRPCSHPRDYRRLRGSLCRRPRLDLYNNPTAHLLCTHRVGCVTPASGCGSLRSSLTGWYSALSSSPLVSSLGSARVAACIWLCHWPTLPASWITGSHTGTACARARCCQRLVGTVNRICGGVDTLRRNGHLEICSVSDLFGPRSIPASRDGTTRSPAPSSFERDRPISPW